jgi:hypothetical protein
MRLGTSTAWPSSTNWSRASATSPCSGNSYRGVGVPDLIRDARNAARALAM